MKLERDELMQRLEKLGAFLDGDKSSTLPVEVLEDMKLQRKAMTEYAFILSKRYDDVIADTAA
ncbi:crAss001_48 related protein [Pseudomonas extremaustralis]|uniref:crAss001_48 related protein n=1 Tax=Pseudomonas extremaustralis TaxID=359110 RepID=UPI0038620B4E